MGYHFANGKLSADPAIDQRQPELLLYERRGEELRLVGVEYYRTDADQDLGTDDDRPHLFGRAFDGPVPGHEVGAPMHYDLHAWVWTHNPAGMFGQWNPRVILSMSTTPVYPSLRRALPGRIALPGDTGWNAARQAWNLAADQHPVAVASPASAHDVAAVVTAAREHGLRIAAQTTGHAAAALTDLRDTVLLKTADLNGVQIDPWRRRARVGSGTLWIEVSAPTADHALAPLAGSSPDVGVAGYLLGGGLSWLARKHGVAATSLLAAEVVTAGGDIIRTDPDHESDLFWALRGGGGSFAVVTALEFQLFPVPQLYAGGLFWPWQRTAEVLHAWNAWQTGAPDEVTSIARILHLPPRPELPEQLRGRARVNIDAAVLGDQAFGSEVLRPLRALKPDVDTFASTSPAMLSRLHLEPERPIPLITDHQLLGELPAAGIDALLATAGPGSGSRLVAVELRQLGGAVARPAPGAGATASIDAAFALFAGTLANHPDASAAGRDHLERLTNAMRAWDIGRRYMNFVEGPADVSTMFPPQTYQRLRRIKAHVDPGDVIRSNHPIPSGSVTRSRWDHMGIGGGPSLSPSDTTGGPGVGGAGPG